MKYIINLPPGSVVVVGPKGRFYLNARTGDGEVSGCDFISPTNMTQEHRALVDQVWRGRTEDGVMIDEHGKPK